MYSYEDRKRAVALYIKLGKRPKATIRQLGYPSKNGLKGWCLEYEHHLDLRLGFAPRAPKFTHAQKEAAVEHNCTLLKKATELIKKEPGVDLQLLSNREKTLLVDALKDIYQLPDPLAQLGLARSSYFSHRTRMRMSDKYLTIRQNITEIFEANRRCYGYRRLQASLAKQSLQSQRRLCSA